MVNQKEPLFILGISRFRSVAGLDLHTILETRSGLSVYKKQKQVTVTVG
jgi:hypothetical protein